MLILQMVVSLNASVKITLCIIVGICIKKIMSYGGTGSPYCFSFHVFELILLRSLLFSGGIVKIPPSKIYFNVIFSVVSNLKCF